MSDFQIQRRPIGQHPETDALCTEKDVSKGNTKEVIVANEQLANNYDDMGSALPKRVIVVDDPLRQCPFTMKDILNFLVQLLNITAALVFGVWAIRSYDATLQAVGLAEASNALAMFQICQSNVASVCLFHLFAADKWIILTLQFG